MPNLSASDYTQYLKFKAAAVSSIKPAIQTRDNVSTSQSLINATLLASQASQLLTPGLSSLAPTPGYVERLFSYTGSDQTFVVPPGVYSMNVTLNGAGGQDVTATSLEGGPGGLVSGVLAVNPGDTLTMVVGGRTGYGGGGAAGGTGAGSGGGRTAIRRGGVDIVTAGGGGGGGGNSSFPLQGGAGGGSTGESGAARGGLGYAAGLTMDSAGNLYATDSDNHIIIKVTSAGVASVFAGLSGTSGSTDATGSSARFNTPQGIAIDENDNLYVGDSGNRVIRKITSGAVVTTLAGTVGTTGDANGGLGVGRFGTSINALIYDGTANLYVCDSANNKIRSVVISTGVISTFAGPAAGTTTSGDTDGTGTAARFYTPNGITYTNGNLYVADRNNSKIRQITVPGAVVTTIVGPAQGTVSSGTTDADGNTARVSYPSGITNDGTFLYLADGGNNKIRRITIASPYTVTSYTGRPNQLSGNSFKNGTSLQTAGFNNVAVVFFSNGNLFASCGGIRKITPSRVTNYVKDATGGTQSAVGTSGSGAGSASGTTGGAGGSTTGGGGGGGYYGGGGGANLNSGAGGSSYTALLSGTVVDTQGGTPGNTDGSLFISFNYGSKNVTTPGYGYVNNPNALSTLGYAGTSGALSSSRVQQPGGLPTGFKNSQGTYTRLPQNAGWVQGGAGNVSSGPKRF